MNGTYGEYFKHGPRSSKKVNYCHSKLKCMLEPYFPRRNGFDIKLEHNVKACNRSGKKKCDIVVLKNNKPYIIFPVKIIMTNYKQNANNYWENLTGEMTHIKWKNPDIHIIPINIFMSKTPYLSKEKKITKFEDIILSDIENYNESIEHNLCYDVINYIVEVNHINKVKERFDKIEPVKKIITPYRSFRSILGALL